MTTITISGTPGSGKSTVATLLKDQLDLPYIYSGMIFRSLAEEHNMSLAEFGSYCEKNPDIDKEIDEKQVEILKRGNVILEGRLAGWLAYKNNITACKVMIDADVDIRAKRIVKREEGSVEERKKEMLNREESEIKRYKTYYNIDLKDISIYDLTIDSSEKTAEEITELILQFLDH